MNQFKKLFISFIYFSLLSAGAHAQSALYPGAEWKVEHIFGPGMYYTPSEERWFPFSTSMVIARSSVRVNQHMDRMITDDGQDRIVFKRVCQDDIDLEDIPNVDNTGLDRNLTVWEANHSLDDGQSQTILFEQRGGGVLIGTGITYSDNGKIGKGQYTLSPISGIPAPPSDDPQDEPTPDTPKELGLQAVATKLAAEMGVTPDYIRQFMLADVSDEGHLYVRVWLGADNHALSSEREIDDPCDPRYGNITPAKKLYNFKITKLVDDEGTHYFIKTQVLDVETGVILEQYAPDTANAQGNLQQEVSESYDELDFDIKKPRD